jgi:hypothetical protein
MGRHAPPVKAQDGVAFARVLALREPVPACSGFAVRS